MLKCEQCGWSGVNLVPDEKTNTARCPGCGKAFAGIQAKDAVVTDPDMENYYVGASTVLRLASGTPNVFRKINGVNY